MKTKSLMLAALFALAGIWSSFAQVYSVNAVGYVKQSVPANGLNIISIPLNGTNNNLNTTLPLPNGYDGTTLYRYSLPLSSYQDPYMWIEGFGWFSPSDPDLIVNPGEGFWVQNVNSTPLDITFLGEVPSARITIPLPGGYNLKMIASAIPKNIKLIEICAQDGDTVYLWDAANQRYREPISFIGGFGWFSANPDDPGPDGYTVPPATGFWYQGAGTGCIWEQTFSVN